VTTTLSGPHSKKQAVSFEPPKKIRFWLIVALFFAPLILLAGGLVLYMMGPHDTPEVYSYEVDRFSGLVEVYSPQTRGWTKLTRKTAGKMLIQSGQKVRTGAGADVDLKVPDLIDLRLKPSSELEVFSKRRGRNMNLRLLQGSLLAMTGDDLEGRAIEVEAGAVYATTQAGSFLIQLDAKGMSTLSVLDGAVNARPLTSKKTVHVNALETVSVAQNSKVIPKPKRVTYQRWRALNEVRDLVFVSAEEIKEQLELRQEAGNFFQYVFDEGTFFTPNRGYARREFYKDKTGEVLLKVDYDVYPQDSFTGLYFKMRNFDVSKFSRMNFELKAESGKPAPKRIRVEAKQGVTTARGFAVKPITDEWRLYSFKFNAQKPTPVSEIVFVFENLKVGAFSTKGTVYIKNLTLE